MKKFFFSLLLSLACCAPVCAQDLAFAEEIHLPTVNTSVRAGVLDGPTEGTVGQRIEIQVLGLPPLDLTKPLNESLAWLDTMQFKLDPQPGDIARLEGAVSLDVASRTWKLNLWFTPRLNGSYVVVFVSRTDLTITTHRVTVGGVAPVDPFPRPVDPNKPVQPPATKVTRVTYVWEKDLGQPPKVVLSALNKLNLVPGTSLPGEIVATEFEQDTKNGQGQTPAQYTIALEAARKVGIPALVVQAGTTVLRVVKDPKTEEAVMESVK